VDKAEGLFSAHALSNRLLSLPDTALGAETVEGSSFAGDVGAPEVPRSLMFRYLNFQQPLFFTLWEPRFSHKRRFHSIDQFFVYLEPESLP